MIICDNCKQNKPTRIVYFGGYMLDKNVVPNWDLCENCEKELFEILKSKIGVSPCLRR